MGEDFPKEVFLRTPIAVIRKALERVSSWEQERANIAAVTTARLTSVVINVAHGFSGSKSRPPKIKIQDFLPYPEWQPEQQTQIGPSDTTASILVSLIKRHQIPPHVFTALKSRPSE